MLSPESEFMICQIKILELLLNKETKYTTKILSEVSDYPVPIINKIIH